MSFKLMKLKRPEILGTDGKPIVLNAAEQFHADYVQRQINERHGYMLANALGYEVDITTLTTIVKKISEQKFFEVAPADYLPVRVGEGTWGAQLTTYRSFELGADFSEGVLNTGGNNARLAEADAGVDALTIKIFNWGKSIGWNIFDLQMAAKNGNWDLVTSKEKARKKNWDLGIQKIAFLGLSGDSSCRGLLNQSGITNNTTLITKAISSMSTSELKTFTANLITTYRANNNRTAFPTHFIIPESDYLGLASQASPDFPIKSTLELLEEAFKLNTRNSAFKILPLAYCDNQYNDLGVQRYVLLNYDDESLRMDIPLDYTNTLANSLDNFNFQNVGYGQFTGVLAYRPLELMYFSYTPST